MIVHDSLTEQIIGCGYKVSNALGSGFLEKVYENALAIELRNAGLQVEQQKAIQVLYLGQVVGDYVADFIINQRVIVEIKAVKEIDTVHQAQLLNYLKATGLETGLILNFGSPHLGVKRMTSFKQRFETAETKNKATDEHR